MARFTPVIHVLLKILIDRHRTTAALYLYLYSSLQLPTAVLPSRAHGLSDRMFRG